MEEQPERPRLGIGTIVTHPSIGRGRVIGYEGTSYVVVFKGGDARRIAFSFAGLETEKAEGDPETDRIKQAVREVLGEHGMIDAECELASRWLGGTLRLVPGKGDAQAKDIPLDSLFAKLIGIREKLRVLEQKINNHPKLDDADKMDLQGYLTRSYGSLTTFNVLFAEKESHFKGQGRE